MAMLQTEWHLTDDQVLNLIGDIHDSVPNQNIPSSDIFDGIKRFLNVATHIVDNALQDIEGLEKLEVPEVQITGDLSLLTDTLEQLSTVLRSKAPCGETELTNTSMFILRDKLSSYSRTEKAVLMITAFALDYGDFWGLVNLQSVNKLAESVGITKRVPTAINCPDLEEFGEEIGDVNYVIKNTLEAIKYIIKFERLFSLTVTDKNQVAWLAGLKESFIPAQVYWVIITVVACTIQMFCLSNDSVKKMDLSPLIGRTSADVRVLSGLMNMYNGRFSSQPYEYAPMQHRQRLLMCRPTGTGVNVDEDYTFYYGSTDSKWKKQFLDNVTSIINDLAINHPKISIRKEDMLKKLRDLKQKEHARWQPAFKTEGGFVELVRDDIIIVGDNGMTMVKVLEKFDDWKGSLNQFGFGDLFLNFYYNKVKKN